MKSALVMMVVVLGACGPDEHSDSAETRDTHAGDGGDGVDGVDARDSAVADEVDDSTDGDVDADADVEPVSAWHAALVDLPESLYDIWGKDPFDVWAVGDGGLVIHGGPEGWRQVDVGDLGGAAMRGVWGDLAGYVWLVGDGGLVLRWSRAAGRVERIASGTEATLRSVWGDGGGQVWAVGGDAEPLIIALAPSGGKIAGLPDGLPPAGLLAVWGRASWDVWAVGERGMVLWWNGAEWLPQSLADTTRFAGVGGRPERDVVIVGGTAAGVILERPTGASAFANLSLSGGSLLNDVWVGADGEAWAVGENGARVWRQQEATAWQERSEGSVRWRGVWGDARGDVWVVGDGRLERFGPARNDVPSGPLVRLQEPDPDADPEDDVEVVETVEVVPETSETVEIAEVGETETPDPVEAPFEIGTLSTTDPPVFTPMSEGQAAPIIHGPQGGLHVEVAIRFPWPGTAAEVVAGLDIGLFVDGTRIAVMATSGYPLTKVDGGLYQTYVIVLMFDCVFSAAPCTSSQFDGKAATIDATVQPPGLSWHDSVGVVLDDTW